MNSSNEWIENLAKAEIKMEETGELDCFSHLDEDKTIDEYTDEFLRALKMICSNYASAFNAYRGESRHSIKVYSIANTTADFLVFRNSLKLIFSKVKAGTINVSFSSIRGGLKTKEKVPKPPMTEGDFLEIGLGPFREPYWNFKGKQISPEGLVRYYLTEFIKNSIN